jgi:hypothetical protein
MNKRKQFAALAVAVFVAAAWAILFHITLR